LNDYDENRSFQFKLFFTSLTPKIKPGICPFQHLIDCTDSYCVSSSTRCNGIDECQTKSDEKNCQLKKSNGLSIYLKSFIIYSVVILLY